MSLCRATRHETEFDEDLVKKAEDRGPRRKTREAGVVVG